MQSTWYSCKTRNTKKREEPKLIRPANFLCTCPSNRCTDFIQQRQRWSGRHTRKTTFRRLTTSLFPSHLTEKKRMLREAQWHPEIRNCANSSVFTWRHKKWDSDRICSLSFPVYLNRGGLSQVTNTITFGHQTFTFLTVTNLFRHLSQRTTRFTTPLW
jgi:hypothetical protein